MPTALMEKKIAMVPPQFIPELTAFVDFLIYRKDEPAGQPKTVKSHREIRPLPGYGERISVQCDIFADDASLWENA